MQEDIFKYNTTVRYPPDPKKEGYIFDGWDKNLTVMPAENTTVNALWTSEAKGAKYVVVVINNGKAMSDDIVKVILKPYTQDDFFIEGAVTDKKTGKTTVAIRFTSNEEAKKFVEELNKDKTQSVIESATIVSDPSQFVSLALGTTKVVVSSFIALLLAILTL